MLVANLLLSQFRKMFLQGMLKKEDEKYTVCLKYSLVQRSLTPPPIFSCIKYFFSGLTLLLFSTCTVSLNFLETCCTPYWDPLIFLILANPDGAKILLFMSVKLHYHWHVFWQVQVKKWKQMMYEGDKTFKVLTNKRWTKNAGHRIRV